LKPDLRCGEMTSMNDTLTSSSIKDKRFFVGGRSIFTIDNGKGTHYTFRIGRKDETQPYFVGLLTGPNNERDYTYLGIYNPDNHGVRLTQKSKYTEDSLPVKVIRWGIRQVVDSKPLPEGYRIQHEGSCCVCGRPLTDPESIELGIGPICREKTGW
jgi:hypothetical protein